MEIKLGDGQGEGQLEPERGVQGDGRLRGCPRGRKGEGGVQGEGRVSGGFIHFFYD